jgi:hypothetical protein
MEVTATSGSATAVVVVYCKIPNHMFLWEPPKNGMWEGIKSRKHFSYGHLPGLYKKHVKSWQMQNAGI